MNQKKIEKMKEAVSELRIKYDEFVDNICSIRGDLNNTIKQSAAINKEILTLEMFFLAMETTEDS